MDELTKQGMDKYRSTLWLADEEKRNLVADLALCEAATPGPWYHCSYHVATMPNISGGYPPNEASIAETCDGEYIENYNLADAEFIAKARTGWPHSIQRAITAEEEIEQVRKERDRWRTEAHEANLLVAELNRECTEHLQENAKLRAALEHMDDRKNAMLPRSVMARIAKETLDELRDLITEESSSTET